LPSYRKLVLHSDKYGIQSIESDSEECVKLGKIAPEVYESMKVMLHVFLTFPLSQWKELQLWEGCLYRYHENISNTLVGVYQSGDSVFWAVMLCALIDHYHCIRGTYFVHLEAKRYRHQVLLKQYLGLGITEDSNFIVTAVITLNLTCLNLIYNQPLID
jgi:hypothetical protein